MPKIGICPKKSNFLDVFNQSKVDYTQNRMTLQHPTHPESDKGQKSSTVQFLHMNTQACVTLNVEK